MKKPKTILIDRVPDWMDSSCVITIRGDRLFAVSRARTRRWKVWRDWFKRHPFWYSAIEAMSIVFIGATGVPINAYALVYPSLKTITVAMFANVAWGVLMGWSLRRSFESK